MSLCLKAAGGIPAGQTTHRQTEGQEWGRMWATRPLQHMLLPAFCHSLCTTIALYAMNARL
jgi:hypothetical protein